jgi:hypothetical protein
MRELRTSLAALTRMFTQTSCTRTGDVSPTSALDMLSTKGNNALVDIRTAREKESGGSPDLPNSGESGWVRGWVGG